MIIHIVNKSPYSHNCLSECLRFIGEHDSLLLIEDGVYAATANTEASQSLERLATSVNCYALKPDILARGICDKLSPKVAPVSDKEFVQLVAKHRSVQSWY